MTRSGVKRPLERLLLALAGLMALALALLAATGSSWFLLLAVPVGVALYVAAVGYPDRRRS